MTRRMVISEMWEDDFFVSLPIMDRLIWIGIITACADDQGRFQDNAALIRARIFPLDDIQLTVIDSAVDKFSKAGRILRYKAGNKPAIQIVHWWRHQTPQWAGKSTIQSPPGWMDRERYHGKGNVLMTVNWDQDGGYIDGYIADYEAQSPSSDVNVNVNVNVDGEIATTPFRQFMDAFVEETHIPESHIQPQKQSDAVDNMVKAGVTVDDMRIAIQEMLAKNLNITSLNSVINPSVNVMSRRKARKPLRVEGPVYQELPEL